MQQKRYNFENFTIGVCYYPEHWSKELWESDLDRMLETGISIIRIAEFAWNKIEPKEGYYEFDFFDEFLDLWLRKGMKVIFGTPTATPPAWLTEKYPEVLNCNIDGVSYRHGCRRHYNYNSETYNRLSANIVKVIAQHYGKHAAIIGWQIDNELNCETSEFYSEADTAAFRCFLKEKYGTLDELNNAWGTVFWNQTYSDWNQIFVPRPVLNKGYNPHMHLDYYRFVSDSTVRFCKMQSEILRCYCNDEQFIMTNGMFWNVDNHKMQRECLDIYMYDSYPSFAFGLNRGKIDVKALNDRRWTKNLHEVRSICPNFGIAEQQSGANGWTTGMEGPAPRPGQLTLWAMQSVAHGADFVSFFRWRTSVIGTEIYWHGILDYDNRDNRKLKEVKDFACKMLKINAVCGSSYLGTFALLKDYDNVWDTEVDKWHDRIASHSEDEIFAASELTHTPYDVIYLDQELNEERLYSYPVAFYPHPVIVDEKIVERLKRYVELGGTLIIGCRSGYKDKNGHCVMEPQPGLLRGLTGTDVTDFTFVSQAEPEPKALWGDEVIDTPVFNDILHPVKETKTLAVYAGSYYQGESALTENKFGKGRVIHLGSAFSKENVKQLFKYTGILEPFSKWIEAPEEVEIALRQKGEEKYLFVLNFSAEQKNIILKKEMKSMYTGKMCLGDFCLQKYETIVFTWKENEKL